MPRRSLTVSYTHLDVYKRQLYHLAGQIRNLFKKTIEEKGITYIVEMKDVDVRYVVGCLLYTSPADSFSSHVSVRLVV